MNQNDSKSELCTACLQRIGVSSSKELISTYKRLLGKQIGKDVKPTFCEPCIKHIEDVRKFKNACVDTFERATQSSVIKRARICNICHSEVPRLLVHAMREHTSKVDASHVQCTICNVTISKSWIRLHFHRHNKRFEEPQTCAVCKKTFIEVNKYRKHCKTHRSFECFYCGQQLTLKCRLETHILTQHFGGKRCHYCNEMFFDFEEFLKHMTMERATRPSSVCDICGSKFITAGALVVHKARFHDTEEYSCTKCDQVFRSKVALRHHDRQHESAVKCEICKRSLCSERALKRHIATIHSDNNRRKFKCEQCDKAFRTKSLLAKHRFTHTQIRPYNCHICNKAGYCTIDQLKRHYHKVHEVKVSTQEVRNVCRHVTL